MIRLGSCAIIILFFVWDLSSQDEKWVYDDLHILLNTNLDQDNLTDNIDIAASDDFESFVSSLTCYQAGKINHLIGLSFYFDYQEKEAVRYFRDAAYKYWKDCPEASDEERANTIYNMGVSYQYSPEIYKGKQYFDTSIRILEGIEDYPKEEIALKYEGIGYYYIATNNFHRAQSFLQQASSLEGFVDPVTLLNIRINLMILYNKYMKHEKARAVFKETEQYYNTHRDELGQGIKTVYLLNVATVKYHLKEYELSKCYVEEAMKHIAIDNIDQLSNAYEVLGSICQEEGDLDCARENFNRVHSLRLTLEDNIQNKHAESIALHNLSEVEMLEGNQTKALELINKSIRRVSPNVAFDQEDNPILKRKLINFPLELVSHLQLKEKILLRSDIPNADLRSYNIACKIDSIIDKSMEALSFENSKLEFLPIIQTHTDEALEIALKLYEKTGDRKYVEKAFYFSTQAKSYILQQVLQENRFFHDNADPEIIQKVSDLKAEITLVQNRLVAENSDSLNNILLAHEMKLEQVMNTFDESIQGSQWKRNNHLTIGEIRSKIASDLVLLDIYEGERNVFFFWITKGGYEYSIVNTADVVPRIDSVNVYNLDPSIPYVADHSRDLYKTIFTDRIRAFLPKSYRLKIMPEGKFFELNFETLIDESGDYFLTKHPISYAYHPRFVFQKQQNKTENRFLGFGTHYNALLDKQLRRKNYLDTTQSLGTLNNAEAEVFTCNEFMEGALFLGKNASLENFKSNAPDYDIIYLSLHGFVDQDEGLRTGIAFDNSHKQFVLDDADLNELQLQSELIIMSSCHTASGKNFKGEGLKGMTRSFFASGAKNVLSSIWTAGENSSMQILPEFLRQYISGKPLDVSIQESKLQYIESSPPLLKHPFYWGNYVVFGEYEGTKPNYRLYGAFAIGFLILGFFYIFRRKG